ncbi:hypothetical protein RvY_01334 [Ramazzottius varieornatus]|uniref:Uncharacterized protein n=1 Tax=Ramazzottius varieornatus TaxID=947166 RepID=A0A1D1UFY5_RAMVA|nr:hypothetical protein RvY_01334 [Ramazzottius varieornatus]
MEDRESDCKLGRNWNMRSRKLIGFPPKSIAIRSVAIGVKSCWSTSCSPLDAKLKLFTSEFWNRALVLFSRNKFEFIFDKSRWSSFSPENDPGMIEVATIFCHRGEGNLLDIRVG